MVVEWLNNLVDAWAGKAEEDARQRSVWLDSGEVPEEGFDADATIDRFLGDIFDELEDDIIEELLRADSVRPENVDELVDSAEGAAIEDAIGVITALVAIEVSGLGQIESHEEMAAQVLSILILQDVLGARLQWFMEKGMGPALEAEAAKQTRSEFVDLQDAVEFLLRQKTADKGWITGDATRGDARDVIGSNEPVNPDNPLEEWGIRDDNLQILETVGLGVPEPEELFEELPQFGIVPSEEAVEKVLNFSGFPEIVKEDFLRLQAAIPRSADLWEQRTTSGDLVTELDTLVLDGEIGPEEAMTLLPEEVNDARPALRERWELFDDVPAKAPTRSQVENSFTSGLTDIDTFETRLEAVDVDPETYPDIVDEAILSEIDGDLQVALGMGFISDGQYGQLMDRLGLDAEAQEALAAGGDLSDMAEARLQERADPADQPVESIPGIGESRGSGLRAAGIETVGHLAAADTQTVAEAAGVETDTAQEFISAAQQRVT